MIQDENNNNICKITIHTVQKVRTESIGFDEKTISDIKRRQELQNQRKLAYRTKKTAEAFTRTLQKPRH